MPYLSKGATLFVVGVIVAFGVGHAPVDSQITVLVASNILLCLCFSFVLGMWSYAKLILGRRAVEADIHASTRSSILSDVWPRGVMLSCYCWGQCLGYLAFHIPHLLDTILIVGFGLPIESFCFDLIVYASVVENSKRPIGFETFCLAQIYGLGLILCQSFIAVQPLLERVDTAGVICFGIFTCIVTGYLVLENTVDVANGFYSSLRTEPSQSKPTDTLTKRLPRLADSLSVIGVVMFGFIILNCWSYLSNPGYFAYGLTSQIGLGVMPSVFIAWKRRLLWRQTFSWRAITPLEVLGAILIAFGILPFCTMTEFLQHFIWHPNLQFLQRDQHVQAIALQHYQVLAPVVIGISAGVAEEVLFRGLILKGFLQRMPTWAALLVTGFIFAAIHVDFHEMLLQTLLGVLFGWVVVRSRSIFPAILIHSVYDVTFYAAKAFDIHAIDTYVFFGVYGMPIGTMCEILVAGGTMIAAGWLLSRGSWTKRDKPNSIGPILTDDN